MLFYLLVFILFNLNYIETIYFQFENITEYYPENILDIKKMSDSYFFVSTQSKLYKSSIFTGNPNSYREILTNNYTDIYYVSSLDLFIYACTPNFFLALVKNDEIISSINNDYIWTSKCHITYIEKEQNIYIFFAYQNPSNNSESNYTEYNFLIINDT